MIKHLDTTFTYNESYPTRYDMFHSIGATVEIEIDGEKKYICIQNGHEFQHGDLNSPSNNFIVYKDYTDDEIDLESVEIQAIIETAKEQASSLIDELGILNDLESFEAYIKEELNQENPQPFYQLENLPRILELGL